MLATLDQECSEFIPDMKRAGRVLYRGVTESADQFEGRSREDREPKDSNPDVSAKFDEMLTKMGFETNRSNSIYTSGSFGFAESYGTHVYIIMPKNGFDWLIADERDLVLDRWSKLADNQMMEAYGKQIAEWMKVNDADTYKFYDLESMVAWENWDRITDYAIENRNNWNLPPDMQRTWNDFITLEAFKHRFNPSNIDLAAAIQSKREVLIRGEYWALRNDKWADTIKQHYGL